MVGTYLAWKESRRLNMDQDTILDLSMLVLFSSLLGARLLHALVEKDPSTGAPILGWYIQNPLELLKIWRGGYAFLGGFLVPIPLSIWFLHRRNLKVLPVFDLAGMATPIGLFFGRIGCFLSGCCFGKPIDLPWAITFPHHHLTKGASSLHPTQLYSALANLLIFLYLYLWLGPRKKFDGQVLCQFVILYSITRFTVEFFRADNRGLFFDGLISTSQLICVPMIAVISIIYWRLNKT